MMPPGFHLKVFLEILEVFFCQLFNHIIIVLIKVIRPLRLFFGLRMPCLYCSQLVSPQKRLKVLKYEFIYDLYHFLWDPLLPLELFPEPFNPLNLLLSPSFYNLCFLNDLQLNFNEIDLLLFWVNCIEVYIFILDCAPFCLNTSVLGSWVEKYEVFVIDYGIPYLLDFLIYFYRCWLLFVFKKFVLIRRRFILEDTFLRYEVGGFAARIPVLLEVPYMLLDLVRREIWLLKGLKVRVVI